MAVTEKKYQLGTAENQEFLQDVRDGLLSFGHQEEAPIILEMTALPGKTVTVKHGSQAV